MSDNGKGELTGPYNTLSVVERTKALGIASGTSSAEKKKPPLPTSPKPPISPRASHLVQDRNATKTNGTKSKVPPPVIPYRQSKKRSQSSTTPVHSPNAVQGPPSPGVFDKKSPPPSIQPYKPPQSPPIAAGSYEQPVLRNATEQPKPMKASMDDGNITDGIYSEVDTDVVISLIASKQQGDEYNIAKYGRDDPNIAPPPPPASQNTYESLSRDEMSGHIPGAYEPKSGDIATTGSSSVLASAKVDVSKERKPAIPKLKPPLPAAKPVQFEHTPPKPRRTYATNLQQQTESHSSNVPSNPTSSDVDHRLSKPMPLPRVKSEEEKEPVGDTSSKVRTSPERGPSQDDVSNKEVDKVNPTPAPYCYVDIDIPDSPKPTEKLPSSKVNTSEPSSVVASPNQSTLNEPATAAVKKPAPQSPQNNKPRRRPPPPPPAGGKPKPKPVQSVNQPDSNQLKPSVANKPKLPPHPNTLPDPTPAKPIPPKKWFHLVTKKPGSRSPPTNKKPLSPAVAKDAGSTPPGSKRRDSKRKKFFHRQRQQSSEDDAARDALVLENKNHKSPSMEEDHPDSSLAFGYDTVGPGKIGPGKANEKNTTAVVFKGDGDLTPQSKHRILATYAEVDLSQKIKRSTDRPLTNAHSEECLDKLLPQSTGSDDDNDRDSFVISPYGTLPRQRHKGCNSRSALPIYDEIQKPSVEMHAVSKRIQQCIYDQIEDPDSKKTSKDKASFDSSEMDQKSLPSATKGATDSWREDQPPQVPPQTEDSLKFDSPSPQIPPQTADSLMLDSPVPQIPPQTADSLMLDSPQDSDEPPVIIAYATVDTKDVVTRKLSKEEIAAKTKSLGRPSLKPKSKPAPLPPHPIPHSRKKRLSRTHSAEVSSDSDAERIPKSESVGHKPRKEPLYESVDDLDFTLAHKKPAKPRSPPKVAISASSEQTEFLFKNREFISVGQPSGDKLEVGRPASYINDVTSYSNEDSDDSTDWDSGEEEEEQEDQEEQTDKQRGKVYHIAKELLTTERTFVKGLTLLDKEFRQAVLSANRAHDKPVLSEETLNVILSNVGSLCILNSGLLAQLEDRLAKWDSNPKIGDVLLNTAPFFKLYTEYISNFDKALKVLEESCRKNRAFGELVREFEGRPICANLPLSGYLLETVQRIPRYKLLLQDYLKHLPEDSDDRLSSERSLELISKVAAHVNESIRQVDNFKKLLEVQKKLVGDIGDSLISPSRKLLREGELLKYSRKEIQSRMFFLFTDILIYASAIPPANTTYKVVKRIPLHGMKVKELDDPEVKHGLQIISTCKSFRLGTNTLEEKNQWKKALEDALFEHEALLQSRERYRAMSMDPEGLLDSPTESLGTLAPPWLPDNCVSMCMMCSVRFSLTKRRHHCRACGNIYCAACSSYLAALKYQDNKMDRVCQSCFERLTGNADQTDGGNYVSGKKLPKRPVGKARSAVLEVKARQRNCEISGYLQMKDKRWRKQWLEVAEFALYVFEKHEDVSAKRSISLPGYLVIYPLPDTSDRTQLCITHPGTGSIFFKTDSEEVAMKWVEVFQNAAKLVR